MSYTLHLFGHNADKFAKRLQKSPDQVLAKFDRWCVKQRFSNKKRQAGITCLQELLAGSKKSSRNHFVALCWLGEALFESVHLPEFSELEFSNFELCGIISGLRKYQPPYPMPSRKSMPPFAGYIPWDQMKEFQFTVPGAEEAEAIRELQAQATSLLDAISQQLGCPALGPLNRWQMTPEQVRYAQQQFHDLLDSLSADNLDLLAVII